MRNRTINLSNNISCLILCLQRVYLDARRFPRDLATAARLFSNRITDARCRVRLARIVNGIIGFSALVLSASNVTEENNAFISTVRRGFKINDGGRVAGALARQHHETVAVDALIMLGLSIRHADFVACVCRRGTNCQRVLRTLPKKFPTKMLS